MSFFFFFKKNYLWQLLLAILLMRWLPALGKYQYSLHNVFSQSLMEILPIGTLLGDRRLFKETLQCVCPGKSHILSWGRSMIPKQEGAPCPFPRMHMAGRSSRRCRALGPRGAQAPSSGGSLAQTGRALGPLPALQLCLRTVLTGITGPRGPRLDGPRGQRQTEASSSSPPLFR